MKYNKEEKLDGLVPYEKRFGGKFKEERATPHALLAGDSLPPSSKGEQTCTDYSEEAIPERDPAYCLPDATLFEAQTVEAMPTDVRLTLARCLEQFGMSPGRAAVVATL